MTPHESLSGNGISDTPSPSPVRNDGKGEMEQGDGGGSRGTPGRSVDKPPREDVERVCAHLADRIEGNGANRPSIGQKWRDAARLMLDRDGRTEQQIHAAIDWCQDDGFWKSNIMSLPTLREQYERLRLQAEEQRRGRGRGRDSPAGEPPGHERARQAIQAGVEAGALLRGMNEHDP